MVRKQLPDLALVKGLVAYDEETGLFTWLVRPVSMFPAERNAKMWNTRFAGKPAFNIQHHAGYLYGEILGQVASAHRMAWYYTTGEIPDEVDHINGIRTDNRIANLRNVNREKNCKNASISKSRNKSGVVGVAWDAPHARWVVRIGTKHIGRYKSFDEAVMARKIAEKLLKYHPNHGKPHKET